jgi:hypothetical protein
VNIRASDYKDVGSRRQRGQMVGAYVNAEGEFHGYLREGRCHSGAPNQSLPLDIDDRGRIVGTYL